MAPNLFTESPPLHFILHLWLVGLYYLVNNIHMCLKDKKIFISIITNMYNPSPEKVLRC